MTAVNWIPVGVDLPDDDMLVLVAVDGEVWPAFRDSGRWLDATAFPLSGAPTHWADLPEPPRVAAINEVEQCQR
jgi:hypothetical protein